MCKKMLFAAAIVLILGGVCWASTSDMIPTFPSPYPFTSFSDTDTTALWLFDEANYKNTTLTDASPYEMSDLVLMTTGNTSYKGTLVTGKWGSALNVPGGTSTFAVSYAEFKGSVCKDELDTYDGATSGVWGPTEGPAALLNGLDSGVGTVEFWINLPSLPGSDVPVLQIGFAYSPGWTLDLKSSGTVFEINNAYYGKKAVCPTSLSTNQWVHVAFTQNGSTFRHFVNGTERTTPTVSTITEQALPALQVPTQRDHDHRDFGPMSSDTRRQNRFNISVGHNRQGTSAMTAKFDEIRISKVVRYSGNFTAPGSFSRAYGANPPSAAVATGPALLFAPTSTPVQLGGSKYMFIDQAIVDSSSNVTITCNPPTNGQDLGYQPTYKDERPSYFDVDGTVYMLNPRSYGGSEGVTWLLTSSDGINWSQPNCGTWGSNNIALWGNPMYSEAFVDTNPNISSQEKYKFTGALSNRGIYMYFSPDGINWRRNEVAMLPIMVESGAETFFDDQTGTYYDVLKRDSSYNQTGCTGTGRRGVLFEADEYFKTWPFTAQNPPYWEGWTIPCLTCEGPVVFSPNANGEVYRARVFKYPWAPDVYLAFIWRFPTSECRQVDLGVSRDGLNWTYFATNWYMGNGSYGEALSSYGLVKRDAGHLYNVTDKDEIWQYFEFGGCHDGEPRTRKRYIQRLDGFTSLDAGGTTGTVITKPLVFDGSALALNVKATGTVKVALLNEAQQEISGYGLANCDTITGDSLRKAVTWGGNSDVSSLDGTVIRVKFQMTNAKLYAMQFLPSSPTDTTPPTPDPMTWATSPYGSSPYTVSMTATTATDTNAVKYYFACTAGGGHDSGWQNSSTYVDTGLQPSTQYTYKVQARDKSDNQNVTGWSGTASGTTLPPDTVAPTPNPMTWATVPYATSAFSISMTATTASDPSGFEYYFDCTTVGGHDSGWQDSATYEDTGLLPSTQYTYRVQARDKSPYQNATSWSSSLSATTSVDPGSKAETFDSASSATSHGWVEYKSRANGNNFGFSNTNYAGGASAGEGGGTFKRVSSANAGYYADTALSGTLGLNDAFFASGKLTMSNSTADGHWWLGHLGTSGFDGSTKNLAGFRFQEYSSTEVRVQTVIFLSTGATIETALTVVAFTSGNIASFDYAYDPAGNGGLGQLVAHLRNSSGITVYTGTLNLASGDKAIGAALNAFGAAEGALTDAANYINMYFDDLWYSRLVDTTPPTPNPATFASAPAAISSSAISMTATTGTDATGPVQYYFDETSGNPGGTDSGWQTSASYTDSGLNASTQYTYTVQMRDSASTPNVGTASAPASATTNSPSAPTYVAAGAVSSGTGTITPALPSGIATGDILLLFLETSNQAISISNQNGGTWTAVTNSPQYCGTAAGTTGARLTAFWSRYNGTQGAPTTSDSGDHQLGRIVAIRGAASSGDPWNVTAGGVEAVSDTSGSIPGATTTVSNTLVVTAIATSLPDASSTAKFSGWTNANLTSLTERTDNSVTAGNGGGLAIATGVKATAGAYGNTAVTLVNAAYKGMMSIALKN